MAQKMAFLHHARALVDSGRCDPLIISDKDADSNQLFTQDQILVSQLAIAIKDDQLNPHQFSLHQTYSPPIIFALARKLIKSNHLQSATDLFAYNLRTIGKNHRHIILYNIAKLESLMGNRQRAIFQYETLLKETGWAEDYFTYDHLSLLLDEGRIKDALQIAQRNLHKGKHKVQQIYLVALKKKLKKPQDILRQLIIQFHNRNVSLLTLYNIAIVLKESFPEEALRLFRQVDSHLQPSSSSAILLRTKANILLLLEQMIQRRSKTHPNDMFEQNEQEEDSEIESMLIESDEICQLLLAANKEEKQDELLIQKHERIKQALLARNQRQAHEKQQENRLILNIFESEANKKRQYKMTNSFLIDTVKTQRATIKQIPSATKDERAAMDELYNKKRKQNDQRLKFLMKKQRELKKFFQGIKDKTGKDFSKNFDPPATLRNSSSEPGLKTTLDQSREENVKLFEKYEKEFQEKKNKLQFVYKQAQIHKVIEKFFDTWLSGTEKCQKDQVIPSKLYRDKIKRFVKGLESDEFKQNTARPLAKSSTKSSSNISSKQSCKTFRVKKNTKKAVAGTLLGVKLSDAMHKKMLTDLKNHTQHKLQDQQDVQKDENNLEKRLLAGEKLQKQKKLEEAHDLYATLYKDFKDSKDKQIVLLRIARNFENLGFDLEAEKTYEKCTKYNNIEAFFKLGCLQIKSGLIEKGTENLEKANCIDRYNPKIETKLVYAYSLLDETTDRALALANNILKRNPQSLEALLMTSKILSKKGRLKQALDIALAISNTKASASIFHYIGLLYLSDSNVSEAFKYFQKAIQSDSTHVASLIELATIISEINTQEAINILTKVINHDPKSHLAYARLGKIYETFQQDYHKALQFYKKGLEIQPTYESYIKIGDCLFAIGSIVDAYLNYKQALQIRKTPEVFQKIGQVHQRQGQDRKAIQSYTLSLKELSTNHNSSVNKRKDILFRLGKLALSGQDFDAAQGYLFEAAELEESLETFKLLGQACYGKGQYYEALQYFQKYLKQCDEDNLQILESIAMCYDKQEEFLASKEIYQKILAVDPKNIRCLNNLANIYLILGKTNEAFYWFEFMLQQIPHQTDKRLRVADIYATIGDWSKVEQHLLICYKQKEHDVRVLERMVNLYKEKREIKQANKFEKKINLLKQNKNNGSNAS